MIETFSLLRRMVEVLEKVAESVPLAVIALEELATAEARQARAMEVQAGLREEPVLERPCVHPLPSRTVLPGTMGKRPEIRCMECGAFLEEESHR